MIVVRPGGLWALLALAAGVATAITAYSTAAAEGTAIGQLLIAAVVIQAVFLFLGWERWVGVSTVPMVAAMLIESGTNDEPFWIRATVIGCLWYATIELSWEAIARRFGGQVTMAAVSRRVQDVATVVGVALVVGLVAATGTQLIPRRTAVLEALVLGLVLIGGVVLIRGVRRGAEPRPGDAG
jgi:hypothetical protein